MNLKHQLITALLPVIFLCACSHDFVPPSDPGVFADTSKGLIEVTTYAEPSTTGNYSFPNLNHSPASPSIRAFYVNMSDISIASAKVFWSGDVRFTIHEDRYSPLETQIECLTTNSYKISCPNLSRQHAGYALLRIKMHRGVADRMYVVKLSD